MILQWKAVFFVWAEFYTIKAYHAYVCEMVLWKKKNPDQSIQEKSASSPTSSAMNMNTCTCPLSVLLTLVHTHLMSSRSLNMTETWHDGYKWSLVLYLGQDRHFTHTLLKRKSERERKRRGDIVSTSSECPLQSVRSALMSLINHSSSQTGRLPLFPSPFSLCTPQRAIHRQGQISTEMNEVAIQLYIL